MERARPEDPVYIVANEKFTLIFKIFFCEKWLKSMGLKNLLLDSKQNLINMDLGSKNFIIKLVDRIDALFEFHRDIPLTSKQG